ncbi:flagellar biosynthesis protein FlhF [Lysobacter sp. D1-1-M9]|uniref:flagellar biosynthesis protein FlhF n=1 Tax=Novilysobacter longmucuonensis TaxID=3098603 RepID=UPI0039832849
MRIKRFTAPDMRTGLRMVRDEQGADAVILSNRPVEGGIEIVAATDYDEALVQQALRAAAPRLEPLKPKVLDAMPASSPPAMVASAEPAQAAAQPAPAKPAATKPTAAPPPVRETLATRARAVFRLGGEPSASAPAADRTPTLAELTSAPAAPQPSTPPPAASPPPSTARFDEMMAALAPAPTSAPVTPTAVAADTAQTAPALPAQTDADAVPNPLAATKLPSPAAPKPELQLEPMAEPPERHAEHDAGHDTRHLRSVGGRDLDPGIAAMRDELANMRQLIEREMGQFAVERLRGSPARAAAYDTLLGYGCDENLAQAIAAKLDPQLDPAKTRAPMLAELARMLTVSRSEPIDEGGVIALIGPTGAGKTTTLAKLAARYAQRHRARDVALVTTDVERAGAREQLQAHGRTLGITVCEASGPEGLPRALEQLADYPLVLVDTAGYAVRDLALLSQITWLRANQRLRSLLVLPANANPYDLGEVVRRYRLAAPEGVVLTKLDETGRLGAALSVAVRHDLKLIYTTDGQQVPADLDTADASRLVLQLEKLRRAADCPDAHPAHPLANEDRHVVAS